MSDASMAGHDGSGAGTAEHSARGAVRTLISRLAVVAVQGERLQGLCSELDTLVSSLQQNPEAAPAAAELACALQAAAAVARDIAVLTDSLRTGLQPEWADRRVPRAGAGAP